MTVPPPTVVQPSWCSRARQARRSFKRSLEGLRFRRSRMLSLSSSGLSIRPHNLAHDLTGSGKVFAEHFIAAEVDVLSNAGYPEVTPERTNSRNGIRRQDFGTGVGTIDLAIPKLRHDSYHPGWLLKPRRVDVVGTLPNRDAVVRWSG
jgi:hypothetical protein